MPYAVTRAEACVAQFARAVDDLSKRPKDLAPLSGSGLTYRTEVSRPSTGTPALNAPARPRASSWARPSDRAKGPTGEIVGGRGISIWTGR